VADVKDARQSLKEEHKAIKDYGRRLGRTSDTELKKVFSHNRGEEKEHAADLARAIKKKVARMQSRSGGR
jgi:hypothetical protein